MKPADVARAALLAALAAALALAFANREAFSQEALQAWLASAGWWAPVLFIALYAAGTVLFLPGSVLTLAAGALFGILPGALYSLAGATLGAFSLRAEGTSGTVLDLDEPMTITLRYDAALVSGTNVPMLYARSALMRSAAVGWERIAAEVDFKARQVSARTLRMTDYVLIAAPGALVYAPVLMR